MPFLYINNPEDPDNHLPVNTPAEVARALALLQEKGSEEWVWETSQDPEENPEAFRQAKRTARKLGPTPWSQADDQESALGGLSSLLHGEGRTLVGVFEHPRQGLWVVFEGKDPRSVHAVSLAQAFRADLWDGEEGGFEKWLQEGGESQDLDLAALLETLGWILLFQGRPVLE